jgi:hypothetical protein
VFASNDMDPTMPTSQPEARWYHWLGTDPAVPKSERARKLRQRLLEFLRDQARQTAKGERLLGSSEVLESIIGELKKLAGECGHHGLTGMVLGIGELVGTITVATAQAALKAIPNRDV